VISDPSAYGGWGCCIAPAMQRITPLNVLLCISGNEDDRTVRCEQSVSLNVRRKLRAIDSADGAGCRTSNEHCSDENAIGSNVRELFSQAFEEAIGRLPGCLVHYGHTIPIGNLRKCMGRPAGAGLQDNNAP